MTIACTFALNRQATTLLSCAGVGIFPAFSGREAGRNNPAAVGKPALGPLPPGRYYIVDRQSGGRLGWLYEMMQGVYGTDRSSWFALYRNDGLIDDATMVDGVRRGAFRLHPIGPRGLSEGCITMTRQSDFDMLRAALKKTATKEVAGAKVYGTIDVC